MLPRPASVAPPGAGGPRPPMASACRAQPSCEPPRSGPPFGGHGRHQIALKGTICAVSQVGRRALRPCASPAPLSLYVSDGAPRSRHATRRLQHVPQGLLQPSLLCANMLTCHCRYQQASRNRLLGSETLQGAPDKPCTTYCVPQCSVSASSDARGQPPHTFHPYPLIRPPVVTVHAVL